LYGAIGNNYFRYYNRDMARSITLAGQMFINKSALAKNNFIGRCLGEQGDGIKDRRLYSDTDSCIESTLININNSSTTIGDFFETAEGEVKEYQEGKFIKTLDPSKYSTLTVNKEDFTKIEETSVRYIMKHKTTKELFKVKFKGKEIVVTGDHSLMFVRDSKLVEGTVKDIQRGDKLVAVC